MTMNFKMLDPALTMRCENPGGWTFDVPTFEIRSGVRVAKIRAVSPGKSLPPTFSVVVSFPQPNYPVVEAESEAERIGVFYDPAVTFDLGPIVKPTYVIDGVTGHVTAKGAKKGKDK